MPHETHDDWPVLKTYVHEHLNRVALPLGGIGTGTVSLGGRGDLRDWEIMNRPAKGYVPGCGDRIYPFFALHVRPEGAEPVTRALEGPVPAELYEGSHGSVAPNHGLPRFRECSFSAAYPFGQVCLSDRDVPVAVRLEAFNPMIPGDAERSGIPVAVLRYVLTNTSDRLMRVTVCGTISNFIGNDGTAVQADWKGDAVAVGEKRNRNELREDEEVRGLHMFSEGVPEEAEQWGTMALATTSPAPISHRTAWAEGGWGTALLDFWDDLTEDGRLDRRSSEGDSPPASLAVTEELAPEETREVTFLLTWHFPNRMTWTPAEEEEACCGESNRIGNYYTTRYSDAWDVARTVAPELDELEADTLRFVDAFCSTDLPEEIKEAALFNLSTLRSQTCFRTEDGRFFGWEGCCNQRGCCHGSCTHVWNYEQATAFLYGSLSRSMREVEFAHATDERGLMSFRTHLPLERANDYGWAAADGQMGCLMKLYRDWQLSGDDGMLEALWPKARKALEFCWIPGGWDADRDGVMEGCQHNTMDVEYFGPNPQMTGWYLGALRAAEEMACYLGEHDFAHTCHQLFESGSEWMDEHLFNGEYYEHEVRAPESAEEIAEGLRMSMGAEDVTDPDFQLGPGCLVDQLVGQYMAHVAGLGYLHDADNVHTTLRSIMSHNFRSMEGHFNCMRSFALGEERAILMASYPHGRPESPFSYFTEVMTGFEYTAAVGMLQEGDDEHALQAIGAIRERYDGRRRNPFDEAECGHYYARAMASWAAVPAWTGFHYSAVEGRLTFGNREGSFFWSNGDAWGTVRLHEAEDEWTLDLQVLHGELALNRVEITRVGEVALEEQRVLETEETGRWDVPKSE